MNCNPFANFALLLLATSAIAQHTLLEIPDSKLLRQAPGKYLAVFEIKDDELIGKEIRNEASGALGLAGWKRIKALFPLEYRSEIVQFNVQDGDRWAGMFDGDRKMMSIEKVIGFRLPITRFEVNQC